MKICKECGKEFEPRRSSQVFCCSQHQKTYNQKKYYKTERGKKWLHDYYMNVYKYKLFLKEQEKENETVKC